MLLVCAKLHKLTVSAGLQPLTSISMAEDRRLHQADLNPLQPQHGSSRQQPPTEDASQAAIPAAAAAAELPGYTDWLQLQYQKQLEAAIARTSCHTHVSPFDQADAQISSHHPIPNNACTRSGPPYLQPHQNFAPQLDNSSMLPRGENITFPALLSSLFGGFEALQHTPYSADLSATAVEVAEPSMSTEYLVMLAQMTMQNAAEGGYYRQTAADHTKQPATFGGEC